MQRVNKARNHLKSPKWSAHFAKDRGSVSDVFVDMSKSLNRVGRCHARVGKVLASYGTTIGSYFRGQRLSEFFKWVRDDRVNVPDCVWCWTQRHALRRMGLKDACKWVRMTKDAYNRSRQVVPPVSWALRRGLREDFKSALEARRSAGEEMRRFLAGGPRLDKRGFVFKVRNAIERYYDAVHEFEDIKSEVAAMSQDGGEDDGSDGDRYSDADSYPSTEPYDWSEDDVYSRGNGSDDDDWVPQTPMTPGSVASTVY